MTNFITLSLQLVIQDGKTPSFENVVEEAYTSFPGRFSFQGHPEWPHTLVIDRSIRRCATDRNKRWISGRAATGYKLLPAGETVAKDTFEKVSGQKPLGRTAAKSARPTQSGRVVKHIEESNAFQKYRSSGNVEAVTEYDLCDLLYCTVESTPDIRFLFSAAESFIVFTVTTVACVFKSKVRLSEPPRPTGQRPVLPRKRKTQHFD